MQTRALIERLEREVERFKELEMQLSDPEIASDPVQLKDLSREHAQLTPRVRRIEEFLEMCEQLSQTQELLKEESEAELRQMAEQEAEALEKSISALQSDIEYLLIPADPDSGRNLLMEIRAGTGGEEAGLFVSDLLRMYLRFGERTEGVKAEVISAHPTEIGGYKEVVVSFSGDKAFDLLHREGGAHRVQRIPVTESGGRIHTSAVTVAIMPEYDVEEVEVNEGDLEIDVFRASGAGGQHVNKTESAIRITHIPSGIVVSCQDERSQHKNKARAMRILASRLADQQRAESAARDAARKKEQVKSGDRSERIRTYNFPQGRVTDHRIGYTAYNLDDFMDGGMGDLLEALLRAERDEKLQALAD